MCVVALSTAGCGVLDDGAYDLPLPGGPDAGTDPSVVRFEFRSAEGLVPKSRVKLGNVTVGEVEDIKVDRSTWTAVVKARIRSDLGIPENAEARLRTDSLLGEWYVDLQQPEEPSASPLRSGAVVPLASTSASAPVEDVLGALSLLLNNGNLPQLNTVVTEINRAFDGNETEVRALLGDLEEFTAGLDSNRRGITAAIDGMAVLSKTLRDNRRQIATVLDGLPKGIEVLADQREQLVEMLEALDRLSGVAVRVVKESQADVVADLTSLRPILAKLSDAGQDLTDSLKLLATFPFSPGAIGATRGDYVNVDNKVELDLLTVLETLLPLAEQGEVDGSIDAATVDELNAMIDGLERDQSQTEPDHHGPPTGPDGDAAGQNRSFFGRVLGGLLGGTP